MFCENLYHTSTLIIPIVVGLQFDGFIRKEGTSCLEKNTYYFYGEKYADCPSVVVGTGAKLSP